MDIMGGISNDTQIDKHLSNYLKRLNLLRHN